VETVAAQLEAGGVGGQNLLVEEYWFAHQVGQPPPLVSHHTSQCSQDDFAGGEVSVHEGLVLALEGGVYELVVGLIDFEDGGVGVFEVGLLEVLRGGVELGFLAGLLDKEARAAVFVIAFAAVEHSHTIIAHSNQEQPASSYRHPNN
jgi:hypothetical protein